MCARCDAVRERREAAFRLALVCDPLGTALRNAWQRTVDEGVPADMKHLLSKLD